MLLKLGRGGSSPDGYNYNGYNYDDYNSQQPPQDSAYYQQGDEQDEQQDSGYYNSNEIANNQNFGDAGDSWPSYQEQQPQYNAPPPPPNRQDQGSSQQSGYFGAPPPPPPQQYQDQQQQGPPPPVSAVSPAETTRTPIHYKFPSTASKDKTGEGDDAEREEDGEDNSDKRKTPEFASPRDDAVTRYMMTKRGKLQLLVSSALVGGSLGAFGGKSLFHIQNVFPCFTFCLFLSFFTAWLLRNPYGELIRAMGLALILVLKRTRAIRKDYPTWPYVPSFFHLKPRMTPPFPPSSNPWRYTPRRPSDVDFQMFPSVVAMGLVGSAVGGSIPLLPTWMGSLAGAATFALSTTLPNARGDLCRIMGMRVVATTLELWDIQADLEIIPKMGVVGGKIMDKILILDRKHRIKDRLVTVLSWGYDQAMKQADAARGGSRDSGDGDRRRRADDDDRRRRGRDDRDGDRRRDRPPPRDGRDEGRRGRFDDKDDRDGRRPRDELGGRGDPRRREGGASGRDMMGGPSSRDDDRTGRMRRDGRDGEDGGDRYRSSRPRYDDDDDRRRGDNRRGDESDRRGDERRDDRDRSSDDDRDNKEKKGRMFWN